MSAKDFSELSLENTPATGDHIVGYKGTGGSGTERRFLLQTLANSISLMGSLATDTEQGMLSASTKVKLNTVVYNQTSAHTNIGLATSTLSGLLSAAEKILLTTLSTTNAYARSNHTGTQTASTISDLNTAIANSTQVSTNTASITAIQSQLSSFPSSLTQQNKGNVNGNIPWDADLGSSIKFTLTSSGTLQMPTNAIAGHTYMVLAKQDSTGGRTLSYATGYKFPSNTPLVISTATNDLTIIAFYYDGNDMFGVGSLGFTDTP